MHGYAVRVLAIAVVLSAHSVVLGALSPQPSGAGSAYSVVKVCSLVPLAEVKKLAPWPAHMDAFAKAEEEAIGTRGSSCNYPTVHAQVLSYRQDTIDALRKEHELEPVPGIGEAAYLRNNKGNFAELFARVGPHLLTLQMDIGPNRTYESVKPALLELGKTFASRLK